MADYTSYLQQSKTIAIVGCSGRSSRTSHTIARYLISNGFTVIPVNPNYEEVLEQTCYPDLAHIPNDIHIDIVNVFRHPRHTADVARQVVAFSGERGYKPLLWTQLGVSSEEARKLAETEQIPYVTNRCIMVEHRLNVGHVTG